MYQNDKGPLWVPNASRVIDGLRRQFADLDALAGPAGTDAAAADLVGDAKQSTRQHLDALEQLAVRLKAGLAGST